MGDEEVRARQALRARLSRLDPRERRVFELLIEAASLAGGKDAVSVQDTNGLQPVPLPRFVDGHR